jgi:hypothetical protein
MAEKQDNTISLTPSAFISILERKSDSNSKICECCLCQFSKKNSEGKCYKCQRKICEMFIFHFNIISFFVQFLRCLKDNYVTVEKKDKAICPSCYIEYACGF